MSVDFVPTSPDCGDDLVYRPATSEALTRMDEKERGNWQCPDCKKWFDFPDYTPEDLDPEKH